MVIRGVVGGQDRAVFVCLETSELLGSGTEVSKSMADVFLCAALAVERNYTCCLIN